MKSRKNIFTDYQLLALALKKESAKGKTIVFTNGCFDLLHKGHISYLNKAKELGDLLVLGCNSDASVKRIKGRNRPLVKEKDRAFHLANLKAVDYVCLFSESTPGRLIRILSPDVLVKGGDYKKSEIAGAKDVERRGGLVAVIPFIKGYSTTNLIKKIARLSEEKMKN